jgi:hypothetical protein
VNFHVNFSVLLSKYVVHPLVKIKKTLMRQFYYYMYDIFFIEFLILRKICNQIASNDVWPGLIFRITGLAHVRYEFEALYIHWYVLKARNNRKCLLLREKLVSNKIRAVIW